MDILDRLLEKLFFSSLRHINDYEITLIIFSIVAILFALRFYFKVKSLKK